jgi:hypothetical protein
LEYTIFLILSFDNPYISYYNKKYLGGVYYGRSNGL